MMDDGRWKMEDGRWMREDGRWKMSEVRTQMSDVICTAAIPFTAKSMAAGFNAKSQFSSIKFGGFGEYHSLVAIKRRNWQISSES